MSTYYNTRIHEIKKHHYVNIIQNVHASFVNNTFHVYINNFLSSHSVSYGLVDTASAKLMHCRSVWGSIILTYPQSLFYLTCPSRIITKCTVLKKDNPCCGNFYWNGLSMGFQFTISMQCTCLWVLFLFRKRWSWIFYGRLIV